MSTEGGVGESASIGDKNTRVGETEPSTPSNPQHTSTGRPQIPAEVGEPDLSQPGEGDSSLSKEAARSQTSQHGDAATLEGDILDDVPRQVIAVSASKGPAAFFNLARKFLATDEMCDLSALEGAIVSAVDAAHLLERSQLATIVR